MLQFHLSHLGLAILAGAVLLSGAMNNAISGICVGMAVICWLAAGQAGRQTLIGLAAVAGWLLLAALLSAAYRII